MDYKLVDLIEIPRLQELLDSLHNAFGLTTAILDTEGNVLISSGWQDICANFHLVNPTCLQQCRESDLYILSHMDEHPSSVTYKCMQGLVDSATPIMIAGKHLGNAYIGQFLLEPPDTEYFRKQARKYGFDEKAYLDALAKIEVLTDEELEQRLRVIRLFTEFVGEIGLERLKEIESRERLTEAQHIAHLGSWGLDLTTNNLTWSDETYRILGIEPQAVPPAYEVLIDNVHPDDREWVDAVHTQSLQQGTSFNIEYRIVRISDGEIRYINEICEYAKGHSGKVVRFLGMLHDITERKHSEEALHESQRKFATLMSNLPGMAYRSLNDKNWTMELVSEGALELTGYQPSDLVRDMVSYRRQVIHPDDQKGIWEKVQAALDEDTPFQIRYRIITASGDEKWVWEQGRGIYSPTNELLALEGFITDITDEIRADEELRFANVILRTQQEASIDGILVVDDEGSIISLNQRFIDMWSLPADIVESRDNERAVQFASSIVTEPEIFLARVRSLNEHHDEKSLDEISLIGGITYEGYSAPMFGPDGEFYGRVWSYRDITERIRAEEERRQLEEHLESQKRLFYRESILSVTGGKLEICDPTDVDRYTSAAMLTIDLDSAQDVPTARHEIKRFCAENGLAEERLDSFLDGVGEALANAIKHGIHGIVYGGNTNEAVWVAVADNGKGIESLILPRATLGRGFSTKRSMGLGYTIILSVVNHVMLSTGPTGTTVVMIMDLVEPVLEMSLDSLPDTWD